MGMESGRIFIFVECLSASQPLVPSIERICELIAIEVDGRIE